MVNHRYNDYCHAYTNFRSTRPWTQRRVWARRGRNPRTLSRRDEVVCRQGFQRRRDTRRGTESNNTKMFVGDEERRPRRRELPAQGGRRPSALQATLASRRKGEDKASARDQAQVHVYVYTWRQCRKAVHEQRCKVHYAHPCRRLFVAREVTLPKGAQGSRDGGKECRSTASRGTRRPSCCRAKDRTHNRGTSRRSQACRRGEEAQEARRPQEEVV
jgi:hypothetical protein